MFKKNKGFTLVEVLVASSILGIIALAMMQITKQQTDQQVQSKISSELTQMKTEIQTYLTSPAHCNANFYGKTSAASTPAAIYKCTVFTAGACHVTPGTGSSVAQLSVDNAAAWTSPNRVRIFSLAMSVTSLTPTAPATQILTIGSITVVFESRTSKLKPDNTYILTRETFTFKAPVVFNGTSVTGCPQSWNSTSPF